MILILNIFSIEIEFLVCHGNISIVLKLYMYDFNSGVIKLFIDCFELFNCLMFSFKLLNIELGLSNKIKQSWSIWSKIVPWFLIKESWS